MLGAASMGVERPGHVVTAVDQHRVGSSQAGQTYEELGVGEEAAVTPVWRQRHVGVFPGTPSLRGCFPYVRVGAGRQPAVGGCEVPVSFWLRDEVEELVPLAWEHQPEMPRYSRRRWSPRVPWGKG